MRIHTTRITCDEKETDQVVVDTIAELLASDTTTRVYKSGTIGVVVADPMVLAKDLPLTYILCREWTDPPPTGALVAPNGGIFLLLSKGGGQLGAIAFFATHQNSAYDANKNAIGPHGTVPLATAGSGDAFVAPRDGTLKNLRLLISAIQGGTNTANENVDFVLHVNGVATTIKVTLNSGVISASLVDAIHTAPVSAGDQITFVVDRTQWDTGNITYYSLSAEIG